MFSNSLRRLPQRFCWRFNSVQFQRNATGKVSATTNATDEEQVDLLASEIFENSLLKHKPVAAKDLLQQQKPTTQKRSTTTKTKIATTPAAGLADTRNKFECKRSTTRTIDDAELGLQYVRLASEDPLFSTLMTTARSRKRRSKDGLIVLEGRRLIGEALACQLQMHTLIFSQLEQLQQLKDEVAQAQSSMQSKLYKVPHNDLKMWSTLSTPPGLLAIFERPKAAQMKQQILSRCTPLPITVVCDNVRESNNLGSIIRTCAALPCQQVVVTRGCCDPWESKALRGGCGGHFRVPIADYVDWEEVPMFIPPESADNCCIFLAENNRESVKPNATLVDYTNLEHIGAHNVVLIGGESHGVSTNAYQFLETVGSNGKCLYIPLANGVESLNVASALTLILYELKKHLPATTVENPNEQCEQSENKLL